MMGKKDEPKYDDLPVFKDDEEEQPPAEPLPPEVQAGPGTQASEGQLQPEAGAAGEPAQEEPSAEESPDGSFPTPPPESVYSEGLPGIEGIASEEPSAGSPASSEPQPEPSGPQPEEPGSADAAAAKLAELRPLLNQAYALAARGELQGIKQLYLQIWQEYSAYSQLSRNYAENASVYKEVDELYKKIEYMSLEDMQSTLNRIKKDITPSQPAPAPQAAPVQPAPSPAPAPVYAARPAGEDKSGELLLQLEKLDGRIQSEAEMRNNLDEKIGRLSEEIGELRSMILDRERANNAIESEFEKMKDSVSDIDPGKIKKDLEKKEADISQNNMQIEKLSKLTEGLSTDLKAFRSQMDKIKSFENIVSMYHEIDKKIGKIRESEQYVDRLAAKVESIFAELDKRTTELVEVEERTRTLQELTTDLMKSLDKDEIRLKEAVYREDLAKISGGLDERVKKIDNSVKDFESKILDFSSTIKEFGITIKELDRKGMSLEEMHAKMGEFGGKFDTFGTSLASVERKHDELDSLKGDVQDLKIAVDSLSASLSQVRSGVGPSFMPEAPERARGAPRPEREAGNMPGRAPEAQKRPEPAEEAPRRSEAGAPGFRPAPSMEAETPVAKPAPAKVAMPEPAEAPSEDVVFAGKPVKSELPSLFKGMEEEPRIELMPFKPHEPVEEELVLFEKPMPAKLPEPSPDKSLEKAHTLSELNALLTDAADLLRAGHLDEAEGEYMKISDLYSGLSDSKVISKSVYPQIRRLHDELDSAKSKSDLSGLLERAGSLLKSGDVSSAEDVYLQLTDEYAKLPPSDALSKSLYPSIHSLHDSLDFERKFLELKGLMDTARSLAKKGDVAKADDIYLQVYQTYSDLSRSSGDPERLKEIYKGISDLHESLTV